MRLSRLKLLRPRFTVLTLLVLIGLCAPFLAYVRSIRVANERKMAAYERMIAKGFRFMPTGPAALSVSGGGPGGPPAAGGSGPSAPPAALPGLGPATAPAAGAAKETSGIRGFWKSITKEPNLPSLDYLKLSGLGCVTCPSNWTDDDLKRFGERNPRVADINIYLFRQPGGVINMAMAVGAYAPAREIQNISGAPAALMKPVADLHAQGREEERKDQGFAPGAPSGAGS